MPYILLGYLTLHPKAVKPNTTTGTMYIEDNSTAIVCEVVVQLCATYQIKEEHISNVPAVDR